MRESESNVVRIESTKLSIASGWRGRLGAAACLLLLAGCGGSSSVSSSFPPPGGPVVGGIVLMPNGQVAGAPSALERLAQAFVARVEALVASNVRPVGAGVSVRLVQIDDRNVVNGQIRRGRVVFQATTDSNGAYSVRLPGGTTPDTCRFYVEVGNTSVTRAFVFGQQRVDVDFQSEATVRLLLDQIKAGNTTLCDLTSDDLKLVYEAVVAAPGQVFGDTPSAINSSAVIVAAADPGVQNAIAIAVGEPTPPPSATDTVPPTVTGTATSTIASGTPTRAPSTATRTVPATRTNTPPVTNTSGPPTRTNTPPATNTSAPPTRTPTSVATATNTVQPPTVTNTPVPTTTGVPTNTSAPTNTAAPTNTSVPTPVAPTNTPGATNTAVPTITVTRTVTIGPTATAPAPAGQVDVGVVAGTAGGIVSVPVQLVVGNGAPIAAVSNEIEYDSAAVDVALNGGAPDCTIAPRLAGAKQVHAQVSALTGTHKLLRVGVIGAANADPISGGPLYTCRFVIAPTATGSVALLNTPEAASPQAQPVAVGGSDGRIDVVAAPPTLGLSAGTAAAGGSVAVTASLSAQGQALAAVATDIHFDTAVLGVAGGSEPDCTLAPAIAAAGKALYAVELPAGAGQALLRVGLIGVNNNTALPGPNGTVVLFQCRFTVQATASGTIILLHSPEGAAPNALPVSLTSEPGSITVQ